MEKRLVTFKIYGAVIILFSVIGLITMTDVFNHPDELTGVSAMFVSGALLFLAGFDLKLHSVFPFEWIAYGLLAGIPVGALVAGNMISGIVICSIIGLLMAFAWNKLRTVIRKQD